MLEENPLTQRAALPGPVEPDHCEANVRQWFQEWIKLLDERIIAPMKNDRGNVLALRGQAKSRQEAPRIGDIDLFVVLHTFHAEAMRACEIIVVAVAQISGGEEELDLMVVCGRIQPEHLCLHTFPTLDKSPSP